MSKADFEIVMSAERRSRKPVIIGVGAAAALALSAGMALGYIPAIELPAMPANATGNIPTDRPGSIGRARQRMLLDATETYRRTAPGVPADIAEGRALAPASFLNLELERQGALWRVRRVNGLQATIYEIS